MSKTPMERERAARAERQRQKDRREESLALAIEHERERTRERDFLMVEMEELLEWRRHGPQDDVARLARAVLFLLSEGEE